MVTPSTFPSLSTSCQAASPQGGPGNIKLESGGGGEKAIILLEAPTLGSPGLSSTVFLPAEVAQWAQGNESWGVGTPETLLVILNPS